MALKPEFGPAIEGIPDVVIAFEAHVHDITGSEVFRNIPYLPRINSVNIVYGLKSIKDDADAILSPE